MGERVDARDERTPAADATTTPASGVTAASTTPWGWRVAFAALVAAIYLVPAIRAGLRGDLRVHVRFAEELSLTGSSSDPYQLFSQLTIIVRSLIPFGLVDAAAPGAVDRWTTWTIAGLTVSSLAVAATTDVVRARIAASRTVPFRRSWAPAAWAAVITLIGPVTFFTWSRRKLVSGYIVPNPFDNGTYLLMRPFAVLVFWLVADSFEPGSTRRRTGRLAAATALVALAKPSLTICLVPAVGLVMAVRWLRRRSVPWHPILVGFFLPTAVVLASQLYVALDQDRGSMALAPLSTLRRLAEHAGMHVAWFLPLMLLSIAYPLLVTATDLRRARRSVAMQLGWLAFAVAVAYAALLEIRGRPDYGELLGATQITLFLLIVEATRWCLSDGTFSRERRRSARSVAIGTVLALQLTCGLAFWYLESTQPLRWH